MVDFSDGISQELNHRVKLKVWWIIPIILGLVIIGWYCGHRYFVKKNFTPQQKYVNSVVEEFKVRRHFDGRAYGSFWDYCGITLTADHVPAEMVDEGVSFVGKPVHRSNGVIDGAHYGEWTCGAPSNLKRGDKATLIGYPGGSDAPAIRNGEVSLNARKAALLVTKSQLGLLRSLRANLLLGACLAALWSTKTVSRLAL